MSKVTGGSFTSMRRFPVLYGVVIALIWAIVGAIIVAFWAHFGTLNNGQLTAAAYIVHCLAVVFGAFGASRSARERGWYYGGITGLVYAVLMVALSLLVFNAFSFDAIGLFRVLLMTLIGAFGGIIGIGLQRD